MQGSQLAHLQSPVMCRPPPLLAPPHLPGAGPCPSAAASYPGLEGVSRQGGKEACLLNVTAAIDSLSAAIPHACAVVVHPPSMQQLLSACPHVLLFSGNLSAPIVMTVMTDHSPGLPTSRRDTAGARSAANTGPPVVLDGAKPPAGKAGAGGRAAVWGTAIASATCLYKQCKVTDAVKGWPETLAWS
jgi:hypothetical protein